MSRICWLPEFWESTVYESGTVVPKASCDYRQHDRPSTASLALPAPHGPHRRLLPPTRCAAPLWHFFDPQSLFQLLYPLLLPAYASWLFYRPEKTFGTGRRPYMQVPSASPCHPTAPPCPSNTPAGSSCWPGRRPAACTSLAWRSCPGGVTRGGWVCAARSSSSPAAAPARRGSARRSRTPG